MHADFRVRHSRFQNLFNDAEIMKDLERPGLNPFSAAAGKGGLGCFDKTKSDQSTRELDGKREAGRACSDDENVRFVHCTNNINRTLYECQQNNSTLYEC